MTQVLTIDLEDWFHCLEPDPRKWEQFERRAEIGTKQILELLGKHHSRATFFVLGDVAQKQPELVREVYAAGHEIGSHGMYHEFVTAQSPQQFREDLRNSIDTLEAITGEKVRSYRAPYFSIVKGTSWALEIILQEGLTLDSSIFPVWNPRYGDPQARRMPHEILPGLHEWPISTISSPFGNLPFSGGVYFRILPWRFVLTRLRSLEKQNEPVLMYLHPWEVDSNQPRHFSDSAFLNLRHYWRLGATLGKLEEVLKRVRFTTLADGFEQLQARQLR